MGGRRSRRRGPRRLVAGLVVFLAGSAAWLAFGAGEVGDSSRLGALSVLPPSPGAGRDAGAANRPPPTRADEAALDFAPGERVRVNLEDEPAAAVLFELGSGDVLWSHRPRATLPVASLTKIMTALLVAEELRRPRRQVKIGADSAGLSASGGVLGSAVGLEAGMRVSVGALFHAMLISSANDVATAGSDDRFVRRMNRRARRLALGCSRFVSAHGLEPENRSCAADLAVLTRLAMEEALVRRVARKPRAVVDFPIDGGERHLATTNPLIEDGYGGAIGLKTGYTEQAGRSLAAVVRRDGRTLGAVLLDSDDPSGQARQLFEAAYASQDR